VSEETTSGRNLLTALDASRKLEQARIFFHADLSKTKIDLKDHDISEGNTKGGFDPVLVELKRFAQKRWSRSNSCVRTSVLEPSPRFVCILFSRYPSAFGEHSRNYFSQRRLRRHDCAALFAIAFDPGVTYLQAHFNNQNESRTQFTR